MLPLMNLSFDLPPRAREIALDQDTPLQILTLPTKLVCQQKSKFLGKESFLTKTFVGHFVSQNMLSKSFQTNFGILLAKVQILPTNSFLSAFPCVLTNIFIDKGHFS